MLRVSMLSALVAVAVGTGDCVEWAHGGVIRHDRADSLYTDLAAEADFASVGRFTWNEPVGSFLASGTLVDSQWVLTAAHVIDGFDGLGAGVSNLEFEIAGVTHVADLWLPHPNWAASGGEANLFAGWDIGLVRLDQPIGSIEPAKLFTGSNELGQVATLVGFGATGDGQTGAQPGSAGTKRGGNNVVDVVGGVQTSGSNPAFRFGHDRLIAVDFDDPTNPFESTLGNSVPLDLEYLTAPGDSGGGLFLHSNGEEFLAGVTSLGSTVDADANSDYGDRASFTRVSQFLNWIDQTIAANSVPPGDGNGDGKVDGLDYLVWAGKFGDDPAMDPPGAPANGDFNEDGVVDGLDYLVWAGDFGQGPNDGIAVPEPTSLSLLVLGSATMSIGRRRARRR